MGWEGANVLCDTLVHPLVMGLEEHLLAMFREDFEFHDAAGPSHLGGHAPTAARPDESPTPSAPMPDESPTVSGQASRHLPDKSPTPSGQAPDAVGTPSARESDAPCWTADGEKELKKIPFFVRGKARRNTESYAAERGITQIDVETLYDAKAHFAR